MRLREIIVDVTEDGPRLILNATGQAGHVWLDCPHCILAGVPELERSRIRLPFKLGKASKPPEPNAWGWNGETDLEKVTFTPSIHILDGHWHGHIENGEVKQPSNTI